MLNSEILIISGKTDAPRELSTVIEGAGYSTSTICDLDELDTLPKSFDFDVGVICSKYPNSKKQECCKKLLELYPSIQIVVLSDSVSVQSILRASHEGCFWVLQEPFQNEDLLYLVARGVIASQLIRENKALLMVLQPSFSDSELVARSPTMQQLLTRLQRISPLDASVLLTGESGVGKTLIASCIHKNSPRSKAPFITVNCANLSRELLESELFGHERGAFTGAVQSRPGTLELCNEGTLFLDEIGELPLELQPKLLTFLQDKQIRRVGGKTSKTVNVRVITATNRNLEEAIKRGIFREDLFYRINVLRLHIPALKERIEDILPITYKILEKIKERRGLSSSWRLSKKAVNALEQYKWPGNVRELEHTLERATAFSDGENLDEFDLNFTVNTELSVNQKSFALPIGISLKELEARYIRQVLESVEGDKQKACKILGISLKTIYNKMAE